MKARTALTVVILATAFLPILNWYYHRLGNGSGEPFGLLALALSIGLAFQNRNTPSPRLAEISLVLYAIGLFFPESGMVSIPGFAHEGIRLIFFAIAGLALAGVARKFHHRKDFQTTTTKPISRRFVALACGVSLTTFLPARTTSPRAPQELLSLESYRGRPVEEVSLSPRGIVRPGFPRPTKNLPRRK